MSVPHFFLMLLVIVAWGVNFVALEVALQDMQPITLCFIRFFLVCFPAIFFVKWPAAPLHLILGYALFIFIMQFSLLFLGMHAGISAGLASLVLQFQVFFTILFAVMFLNEKLNLWQIIGALVAFIGIAVIGWHIDGDSSFLGFILLLCAAACWGVGNLFAKKLGQINMVALVVWASFLAWPPLLLLTLYFEGSDSLLLSVTSLSWTTISAILYIVVGSTLFGYAVWGWLLSRYPITTIAPFTVLIPVVGMLSSALILGESLDTWKIAAGLLIISGFCINMWMPRWTAKKVVAK
jgi:O-acetylserine/cysteine efflux transporter